MESNGMKIESELLKNILGEEIENKIKKLIEQEEVLQNEETNQIINQHILREFEGNDEVVEHANKAIAETEKNIDRLKEDIEEIKLELKEQVRESINKYIEEAQIRRKEISVQMDTNRNLRNKAKEDESRYQVAIDMAKEHQRMYEAEAIKKGEEIRRANDAGNTEEVRKLQKEKRKIKFMSKKYKGTFEAYTEEQKKKIREQEELARKNNQLWDELVKIQRTLKELDREVIPKLSEYFNLSDFSKGETKVVNTATVEEEVVVEDEEEVVADEEEVVADEEEVVADEEEIVEEESKPAENVASVEVWAEDGAVVEVWKEKDSQEEEVAVNEDEKKAEAEAEADAKAKAKAETKPEEYEKQKLIDKYKDILDKIIEEVNIVLKQRIKYGSKDQIKYPVDYADSLYHKTISDYQFENFWDIFDEWCGNPSSSESKIGKIKSEKKLLEKTGYVKGIVNGWSNKYTPTTSNEVAEKIVDSLNISEARIQELKSFYKKLQEYNKKSPDHNIVDNIEVTSYSREGGIVEYKFVFRDGSGVYIKKKKNDSTTNEFKDSEYAIDPNIMEYLTELDDRIYNTPEYGYRSNDTEAGHQKEGIKVNQEAYRRFIEGRSNDSEQDIEVTYDVEKRRIPKYLRKVVEKAIKKGPKGIVSFYSKLPVLIGDLFETPERSIKLKKSNKRAIRQCERAFHEEEKRWVKSGLPSNLYEDAIYSLWSQFQICKEEIEAGNNRVNELKSIRRELKNELPNMINEYRKKQKTEKAEKEAQQKGEIEPTLNEENVEVVEANVKPDEQELSESALVMLFAIKALENETDVRRKVMILRQYLTDEKMGEISQEEANIIAKKLGIQEEWKENENLSIEIPESEKVYNDYRKNTVEVRRGVMKRIGNIINHYEKLKAEMKTKGMNQEEIDKILESLNDEYNSLIHRTDVNELNCNVEEECDNLLKKISNISLERSEDAGTLSERIGVHNVDHDKAINNAAQQAPDSDQAENAAPTK